MTGSDSLSLLTENGYQGILRLKNLQELSSEHISPTKLNWFLTPSDLEQISTRGDFPSEQETFISPVPDVSQELGV